MNITVTLQADKKLLDAIVLIAASLSKTNPVEPVNQPTEKRATMSVVNGTEVPTGPGPAAETNKETETEVLDIAKVRAIAAQISQAGKKDAIKGVLKEMNVTRVTDLKENQYTEFVSKVKAL